MVASSSFTAASAIDGVRGAALLGVGFSRLARTSSCEPALHPGQPAMHLPVCTVGGRSAVLLINTAGEAVHTARHVRQRSSTHFQMF